MGPGPGASLSFEALREAGALAGQQGDHRRAAELFEQALRLNPADPTCWYCHGLALSKLRDHRGAVGSFDRALAIQPAFTGAYAGRGLARHECGDFEGAVQDFRRALALQPDDAAAQYNLARALQVLGRIDEAVASYGAAIERRPDLAVAYYNRAAALLSARRFEEALRDYDAAIRLQPGLDDANARFARAAALAALDRHDEAVEAFRKVDPSQPFALGGLVQSRLEVCDWGGLDRDVEELRERVRRGELACTPFTALAVFDSPALQRRAIEAFARARHPRNDALGPIAPRPRGERIRVGYFSGDFRDHSVSFLMAGLYELHDRRRFEVIAFSFGPDSDSDMRRRLEEGFDRFIDVRARSDLEIAALARELEVDIAVDIAGYTEHSRAGIFAARAAPVQAIYGGYVGTMATGYHDYLFADRVLIPPRLRADYPESVAFLPSYQVNDSRRPIPGKRFSREAAGLPPEGFAFCCLNNTYKITPAAFDTWMRILDAVPGSVLMLTANADVARRNLRTEAAARGIDPQRVLFSQRLDREDYVARFASFDLALDTWPYNATTVACDAMWAGLPVLTLQGESLVARMGASLLHAIGLPELVATTPEEYAARAIGLARDPRRLRELRESLARSRRSSALFDTLSFAASIEAAYERMVERHHAGLPPADIEIAPARP